MEITGGEISGNNASAAAALNCSPGVLLYGNANGYNERRCYQREYRTSRRCPVMLWGSDDDHRTTFTLSGNGTFTGNTCTSVGK